MQRAVAQHFPRGASAVDTGTVSARDSRGIRTANAAAFQETYLGRIDLRRLTDDDFQSGCDFTAPRRSAPLKRLCDVVIGGGVLVALLPLLAITAAAIKIDSRGPVFCCQTRVGRFDRPFTLFGFRGMSSDAEMTGAPHGVYRPNPRITRVGRFIRATRIDQLPQLANVIRGDISLVGPRAERPALVGQLARAIPFYHQRHNVRPGLTGWAQVHSGRGGALQDARETLAYDLYYVKNRSIMLDLIILLSTLRVVPLRPDAR